MSVASQTDPERFRRYFGGDVDMDSVVAQALGGLLPFSIQASEAN